MGNPHTVGFEREARVYELWAHPAVRSRLYMWKDFKAVAEAMIPDLLNGFGTRRPCRRRLRYIGMEGDEPDERFQVGQMYMSVDFNGATYTLDGSGIVIGYAYFEVAEES